MRSPHDDLDHYLSALYGIPASLSRPEWVDVVKAAKASGLSSEQVQQWSAQGDNYDSAGFRNTWRSFKQEGKTGPGTLIYLAKQHGWRDDGKFRIQPADILVRPDLAIQKPVCKPSPRMSAAEVWEGCIPATATHPYIIAKQAHEVPLKGLRVVPESYPLTIAGESMAGALVVPLGRPGGELASLQFIPPPATAARLKAKGKPGKLNLPGASLEDGRFIVGDLVLGGVVYVVEGIGQAWACWRATGHAAVVAFGAGRVKAVAAAMKAQDPSARIVLVPDVGKEKDFEEAARELSCSFVMMPEDMPNNWDVADMIQRDGSKALADLLEMKVQQFEPPHPLLVPVDVAGVWSDPSPPPEFIWGNYIPRGTTTLFTAHGGTGKSTIGLMLAVATAAGLALFGVETVASPAVFVSLEDGAGIVRHRLAGICRWLNIEPSKLASRLFIVDGTENPELYQAESRNTAGEESRAHAELLALVQSTGAGLVLIDNASDAYGGDEIVRRQVRGFIRSLNHIAKCGNSAVVLLAHVDKTTSRSNKAEGGEGYSGSTAWHNSVRSRLFVSRNESNLLKLEHQKSNLGKRHDKPLMIIWPADGFPQAYNAPDEGDDCSELIATAEGRQQDTNATKVLKLLAEYESRGQFASTAASARTNVFALLKADPQFKRLKLTRDSVTAIVTQSQRAGWIEPLLYRTTQRKDAERWTVTPAGRDLASIPSASSASSAPSCHVSAHGAEGASEKGEGAPSAPSS